jgi:Reverse transcriptase (RNA-dependent DNA polymerase)
MTNHQLYLHKVSRNQFNESEIVVVSLDLDEQKGPRRDISCYRGISILAVIPLLFEKIICRKLTPVIRPRIPNSQHGFLRGRSSSSNVIEFSSSIIGNIGDQVDGVYTDFSKAFDRVIHRLLCLNHSRDLEGAMLGWSESESQTR